MKHHIIGLLVMALAGCGGPPFTSQLFDEHETERLRTESDGAGVGGSGGQGGDTWSNGGETSSGGTSSGASTSSGGSGGRSASASASQSSSSSSASGDSSSSSSGGSGGAAPCCETSLSPGCAADAAIQSCVCAFDDYCCATEWDAQCVTDVTELGCGVC
jgi:hypothetical protein